MVYHYTGDVGLYQIFASGNLWMSDYTSMNDPSEINYGIKIGVEELKSELGRRGNQVLGLRFVKTFQSIADSGLHQFMSAYVLSMSIAPDELTQWRLYADGAAGYAMGFDSTILDQAFTSFTTSQSLHGSGSFRGLYDETHLRTQMLTYVRNALDVIQTMPIGPLQEMGRMLGKIGTNLMYAMIYTALYFKHPAYRSEQEYRYLVVTAPNTVPFGMMKRARRNNLIDYLNLDWKTQFSTCLTSIRIGPAADYARGQKFVADTMGLHFAGGPVMRVDQSSIPFRG